MEVNVVIEVVVVLLSFYDVLICLVDLFFRVVN